jgi:hypothetical protein
MMRFESTPAPAEGKFVITLCSVATPVTIPQPRSPQLTRFRFFLGASQEANRRSYTLYMGHFSVLAEAEKWLRVLRGVYPDAFVSEASSAQADSFSDTEVLSILEERRADSVVTGADATAAGNISLLRPDDTSTRLALRDAVTRDAPVSFAVQLQWSTQPVELEQTPRHAIFSSYTLYMTQARIEGRQLFCLRLGFFSDAISAKQVAQYLLADFPSVAVVPVDPREHSTALETGKRSTGAAFKTQMHQEQGRDAQALHTDRGGAAHTLAVAGKAATVQAPRTVKQGATQPVQKRRAGVTLEETLETLRTSGFALDCDDESSATGVRHLQVVVERSAARQSKGSNSHRRKV